MSGLGHLTLSYLDLPESNSLNTVELSCITSPIEVDFSQSIAIIIMFLVYGRHRRKEWPVTPVIDPETGSVDDL